MDNNSQEDNGNGAREPDRILFPQGIKPGQKEPAPPKQVDIDRTLMNFQAKNYIRDLFTEIVVPLAEESKGTAAVIKTAQHDMQQLRAETQAIVATMEKRLSKNSNNSDARIQVRKVKSMRTAKSIKGRERSE